MNDIGIKIIIHEDGYGYIMRRLNSETYEVWSENLQIPLILHKEEFREV